MSQTPRSRTAICALSYLALLAPLAAGLTACGSSGDPLADSPYNARGQITYSDADGSRQVDPGKPLTVSSKGGSRITDVTATDGAGRVVRGRLSPDGTQWRSTGSLAAGTHYTVRVSTENGDGQQGRQTVGFDTKPADNLLDVTFGPNAGVYGVGEPVTAALSKPVKDPAARAAVERGLHVTSAPAVTGSWYWVDDRTLHYRPEDYWPAHATVTISSSLSGVQVSKGVYGGTAKAVTFDTGDKVIAVTDAGAHRMTVYRNGDVERTLPVTTGKPGFSTRNGIKVVLEKQAFVRMKSSTVGIAAGSHDSYDLPVYWATRVTWSGEYVHAAPWSVGSQGAANVSHGCTGMSTANAHWFFDAVRPGDVVQVVGSKGDDMEPFGNGFGDWNLSWDRWLQGSALGAGATTGSRIDNAAVEAGEASRLTPRV
jgi:lipoprotein-anchoring transpeptidase ErfK/SrfK